MVAFSVPQADWQTQRAEWTARFEKMVSGQVRRTLSDVRKNRRHVGYLKKHFPSFLITLNHTRSRPDLYSQALELILALHPTPLYWGALESWMKEIEFAVQVADSLGQFKHQALVLAHQAQILMSLGQVEKGVGIAHKATELALVHHAVLALGMAGAVIVAGYRSQEDYQRAAQFLIEMETHLDDLRPVVDEEEHILAHSYLVEHRASFLRRSGQISEAVELIDSVVRRLLAGGETGRTRLASLYQSRATLLWASGNYQHAIRDLELAIEIYREEGAAFDEIGARGDLGLVYWSMAELDKAEFSMRRAITLADEYNARWRLACEIGNLVAVYMSRGRLEEALQLLEQHRILADQVGDAAEQSRVIGNRGTILLYLGDYRAALDDLQASYEMFQVQGRSESVIASYVDLSYCYFGLGDREAAHRYAQRALDLARESEFSTIRIIALRCMAAQTEDLEKRRALLDEALALARTYGRRLDEAGCLLSLCEVTRDADERLGLWDEGKRLLQECGAAAWLEGATPDRPPFIIMVL